MVNALVFSDLKQVLESRFDFNFSRNVSSEPLGNVHSSSSREMSPTGHYISINIVKNVLATEI